VTEPKSLSELLSRFWTQHNKQIHEPACDQKQLTLGDLTHMGFNATLVLTQVRDSQPGAVAITSTDLLK
jgi:hypothetical protein